MRTPLPTARADLLSTRRRLIGWGGAVGIVTVVAILGLVVVAFSADRQGWNDESRVVQTRGVVVEEVDALHGTCKGGGTSQTRIEWTQDGDLRSAWTRTCRSGPDIGDEVDLWVRDDGQITLTQPATTMVFIAVGVLLFAGLGVLTFFSVRSNVRRVTAELASADPTDG